MQRKASSTQLGDAETTLILLTHHETVRCVRVMCSLEPGP